MNSRGFPRVGKAAMGREIQALLLDYHRALVNEQFQHAWGLLTKGKQNQALEEKGYGKWEEAQASLSPYLEPNGLHLRIDALEDQGVARVDVSGMGWYAPDSPCSEWSGLTWAKYEQGAWRYDPGYSTTPARERKWKPRFPELLGTAC